MPTFTNQDEWVADINRRRAIEDAQRASRTRARDQAAPGRITMRDVGTPPGDAGGARAKDAKDWTGEEIFAYRQTHGGKNPPGFDAAASTANDDARHVKAADEWTGEELYAYRLTHGGKNPPGAR